MRIFSVLLLPALWVWTAMATARQPNLTTQGLDNEDNRASAAASDPSTPKVTASAQHASNDTNTSAPPPLSADLNEQPRENRKRRPRWANDNVPNDSSSHETSQSDNQIGLRTNGIRPLRLNTDYLQFGVSILFLFPIHLKPMCPPHASVPCIFGTGVGLVAKGGYRSRGSWYIGGAYSLEKIETHGLMRMGVLQQLNGEAHYMLQLDYRIEPLLIVGLGANLFGNEGAAETWGLTALMGAGVEIQLTRKLLFGVAAMYRPILFFEWTDRAGQAREAGLNHFWGLELTINAREQLGLYVKQ